ncbi:MAG: DUF4389 domain-containing protein [Pseudomonadota bacterium]|nr:DUF4389 domain-containing protein [Pseudomonadota bacterium]MEC9458388.1 DUF4389 domain-containing protein [Pseudomonadota bacterium]MEC9481568.1 DUF4389 domain-containing protein [Pseudomonadota bacterium]
MNDDEKENTNEEDQETDFSNISDGSEEKSSDDQIALKIFSYVKDFILCVAFLVLAWMSFWIVVVLSILSFVVKVVDSGQLSELNEFSRRLSLYIKECLLFATGNDEEKPFPFNKFPE